MTDAALRGLLDVQELDLAADQLHHRRASLPERLALAEEQAAIARLDVELSELTARSDELRRTQRRLEDEVASIEAKAADHDRKLYAGTVTSPRELQAMQAEVEGLRRRASALEDEILEVMEAVDPIDADRTRLDERIEEHQEEAARLSSAVAEAEAAIDAERADVAARRVAAAEAVAPALLARYEALRAELGGIGVARLEAGRCTGCHLSLPATELDAVRRAPADEITVHEECGRILVRPPAAA
jgi:uncharacterized protein